MSTDNRSACLATAEVTCRQDIGALAERMGNPGMPGRWMEPPVALIDCGACQACTHASAAPRAGRSRVPRRLAKS